MLKNILYMIATIILLIIEVLIALFVHDSFVRPYVGDMLVVIVIYTSVRIFIPDEVRQLPLYIFLFAVFVEVLQYFEVVKILGLQNNGFMRVVIGSVFDFKDIICYFIGCAFLGIYEIICFYKFENKNKK